VDQRPNDVRAFLKAWFEAVEYRLQNPEETRAIAAKYLGVTVNEVQPDDNLKILTLEDNRAIFNLQDANSIYSITKTTSDYLISIGTITQMIDPLELLDPEFLP
jgi:NitT/TauT family transport system substrate-binding protein